MFPYRNRQCCWVVHRLRVRSLASPSREIAASETTRSLLSQIQGEENVSGDGVLQSCTGGLLRLSMPGSVFVGQGLRVGSVPAVVVRFDRTGVVAAALDVAEAGASVSSCGMLTLKQRDWPAGLSNCSLSEIVTPSGASTESLLKLPASRASKRLQIQRHLPSGLAAVEALLPLGEGQRLGLVGPPGTGKSTALRMLATSQAPETAVVFVAHRRHQSRLEAEFAELGDRSAPFVALSAEPSSPAPERYFLLLAALRLAVELGSSHRNVVLAVDDAVSFAEAAAELKVPPMSAAQVVASTLEAAGNWTCSGHQRALSVAIALDLAPGDELATVPRDLWRSTEPSLDICLNFRHGLASKGVYPAIDLDVLNTTYAATFQLPVLRVLRGELRGLLRRSNSLKEKLATGKDSGFQAEVEDVDSLGSDTVARALLTQSKLCSMREVVVLACASVVFYFPRQRPSRSEVAAFQAEVVDLIRSYYPSIWEALDRDLSDEEARRLLQELGEVLLQNRHVFQLTRLDV